MKVRKLCVGLMLPVVLIAIIGLSMTACGETADPTTINFPDYPTLESLPEFTLNTAVHPGGVLLTWDIVKDAESYEVWRQTNEGAVLLGTPDDQTKFADIKTRMNDLKAGIDYKYTVIAVSMASPKKYAAPVPIYNSKAEKTVNFTAENLDVTLTPVSNLKLEVTPSSNVLATWDADSNPLVSYEVYPVDYPYLETVDTPYSLVSLIDGTIADVSVRKVLFKPIDNNDLAYYSPSEDVNAVITVFNMGSVYFEAIRDDKQLVKLTFRNVPDTGLASTFTLSRYQVATSAADNPNWESVPLAGARLMISSDYYPTAYYELYDNTLPAGSENATFVYRLVGKYPDVDQLKSVSYATLDPLYQTISLKTINLTAIPNEKAPASPSTSVDDFETYYWLSHDIETDADYTYYMKQVSGANGVELPDNVAYDWELLTIASADKLTSRTSQTVKVPVPTARTYYEFKVVATGKDSKAGYKGVEATDGPYQFSGSITPTGISYAPIPEYFDIYLDDGLTTTYAGTQKNADGSLTLRRVYSLNLNGLSGSLLREGESLVVEIISNKGDVPLTANVTRTTSWYGNGEGPGRIELNTNNYYFTVPIDRIDGDASEKPLYDIVRLHVTAK